MVATEVTAVSPENRKYERVKLFLPGHLFDPQNEMTTECKVLNLSAGGAAVQCNVGFRPGQSLVLYVNGFGRFAGNTVIHANGQLALEFSIGDLKRTRLIETLRSFQSGGLTGVTELRKHTRVPSLASGSIARENGEQLKCDVLDVSLDGVSLRTSAHLSVGEIVGLGSAKGRVVRHHENGVAIQYVRETGRAA